MRSLVRLMTNVWAVSIEWRIYPHQVATLLLGKSILVGTLDAKALHPEVKGGPLDSQTCGRPVGARDNPPSLLESLANVVSLRVLHGNWSKGLRFGGIPQARERGLQNVARSKDHAPLNEILKFANVARPRVRRQFRHRFRGNLVDLSTHPAGIDLHKVFHQRPNVFTARPQRRKRDRKNIQTIVEIAAKFVSFHHFNQISMGRSYEANVHLVSPAAPQALELLLLQNTQQFWLQWQRNVAHLVEEQRPFVSQFKTANLLRNSARESAFLVTKQLAFQQIERNGGAIQLYERATAPGAEIVNRPCYQLLAGACLSLDKNGGIRRCDALDLFEYRFQSRTITYDLLESAGISILAGGSKSCNSCHERPPCGIRCPLLPAV